jgi:hypothetical protein
MTNLYPNSSMQNTGGMGAGQPGDAPVPGGALATGNPQGSQFQPSGVQPPAPELPVQQLLDTQIDSGQVPVHVQPTNVAALPGTDSLMAMMSRGQIMRGDSTYGQGGFIQPNGGSSPQAGQPAQNVMQSVTARVASVVTINNPPVYTGN